MMERINKAQARRFFESGKHIYLVPNHMRVSFTWHNYSRIDSTMGNFDRIVNEFTYYNCMNSETGTRPAYYIERDGENVI